MPEDFTPRQAVKALLEGIAPPRSLFLPIVFSLGARVENLPLRAFLESPTKISNALRQIRSYVRSDGVTCYFHPYLEMEALGGALQWEAEGHPPAIRWPGPARKGELPEALRSPEDAAKSAPVGVAVEVIRRLNSLLRDGPLLVAAVAGPLTLAAYLTQLKDVDALRWETLPDAALELAASITTRMSKEFVAAGANVILVREEILPPLSHETCETWAVLLAPAFNVIRFYQALPILLLANSGCFERSRDVILDRHWDCIVCPAMSWIRDPPSASGPETRAATTGIALPFEALQPDGSRDEEFHRFIHHVVADLRPAVLTTANDVPLMADMKRLTTIWEQVHR